MPTDPKVMDPVPDPPALDSRLGFDADATSQEADASDENEEG